MEKKLQSAKIEGCETIADSVTEICRRPTLNRLIKLLALLNNDNIEMLNQDIILKEKVLYNLLQLP